MQWGLASNSNQGGGVLTPTLFVLIGSFILEAWLRTMLGAVTPQLTLMAVFICTMTRGWLPSLSTLFVLGVVESVLSGLPFGLPSLMLLVMYMVTLRIQPQLERQPFVVLCVAFSIVLLVLTLAENIVLGALDWPVLSADVFWRWLFSSLACPLYIGLGVMLQGRK